MIKNKQTFSIRETAETLVPDKFGRTSYLLGLTIILLMIAITTLLLGKLPQLVPLYFTLPWGEARLAPKYALYFLPGIAILFLIFNLALGNIANKLSPLLPRVLAVSSAVVSGMMLIALLGIVQSLIL